MSSMPSAPTLLRSLGLEVDGPVRWGQPPSSRAPGVFAVETANPSTTAPIDADQLRRWLERVPTLELDGERPTPTLLGRRLASFWVPDATLLYVGRSRGSLAGRVAALYATELGYRRPHAGGYWLKTLREVSRLNVWWAETPAGEEYEDAILEAFAQAATVATGSPLPSPVLPWANLESPAGETRATGFRGELLDAEAGSRRPSSVQRSDPSGSVTRRVARTSPAVASGTRRSPARPSGAAASTPKRDEPTPVTAEGLAAMEVEVERLRTVDRPAVVERIVRARELGDLRENADYEAARREQSFLEGRIQELERRIRTAVVIRPQERDGVGLGSRVRFEADGHAGELTIVGSTEADPGQGRVSAASPVGRALMGRRAGDEVEVVTPSRRLHYRIVEVS
jgi:transcription elongation factor GreA